MYSPSLLFVFAVIIFIYGAINYYIGLRGWQALFSHVAFVPSKVYWIVFWLVALSYVIARFSEKFLPAVLHEWLTLIGAYWLAAMLYCILIILFIDVLRLLDKLLHFIPQGMKANPYFSPAMGLTVLTLVLGIIVYGAWNASHPRLHHYDIAIAKKAGNLTNLHVVMVSDIHLGTIIHNGRLTKLIDMVNGLQPDLVLFAGDMIDENIEPFLKQEMTTTFQKLSSKYGVFAVLGNHEYIGGNAQEAIKYLNEAGVRVLKDDSVKIADSLYIIGRDDRTGSRFTGVKRQDLSELLSSLDHSLPMIVLDHQPLNLQEPIAQGVDLQLSGHTHAGQLFPIGLITKRIFEDDWGYFRQGNFQLIVSSGYGTWGPPVRIGNTPEIVDISLKFSK